MSGAGLALEDHIALGWRLLLGPPKEHELHRHLESNLTVLQAALGLGESTAPEASDEPTGLAVELARVDNKLNLLLDMVGALLARDGIVPAPVAVELTAESVRWTTDRPPAPGDHLELALYLCPGLPRPVVLVALVGDVEPRPDGAEASVCATFVDVAAPVRDALEKIIFRNHRRRVAQARRGFAVEAT